MYPATAGPAKVLISGPTSNLLKGALFQSCAATAGLRYSSIYASPDGRRCFSTTPRSHIKEFFPPARQTQHIIETKTTWKHPVFTEKQMKDICVAHREAKDWSDWVALGTVRFLRKVTDLATGYKHPAAGKGGEAAPKDFHMDERKWLVRFIFLETVAGVPGMVGGMLRHLRSLRKMKRDLGWIESLLEEAYNERMHLLTFLKLAEPGWFMRLMVLGAQGVFFNSFFISYLLSPRTCHRFVGYLEEEAVMTYTHAINDLEQGKLPKWSNLQAPDIAIGYWNMEKGHQSMLDLLYYIRADEAKHREVNHTLANLNQKVDPNPYTSKYDNPKDEHPTTSTEVVKPTGWERKDVL